MRSPVCRANLDRIQLLAKLAAEAAPPDIPGSRVVHDWFVRTQTSITTYARVREYANPRSGTRMFVQYQPQLPGLAPFKATVIGDDLRKPSHDEIQQIVQAFSSYQLLSVEIAFDFWPESGIDIEFVRRHALFGKSRPNGSRLFANRALYGHRKADKLVRCYWKEAVASFRVELELHSAWLRRNGIRKLEDLGKLPRLLYPNHIRFVRVDWIALEKYLSCRGFPATKVIQRAKTQSDSIHRAMGFLRRTVGVNNLHRFLVTLPVNREVRQALKRWAQTYRNFTSV